MVEFSALCRRYGAMKPIQVVKHKAGFAIVSAPRETTGTGPIGSKWFWSDGQWSRAATHGNGAPTAAFVKLFPT
jgi:hypothetical protein